MKHKAKAAIFIMPRTSSDWQSAEGLWVTARGWAKAAEKYVDKVHFVTRDKITDLEGSEKYPIRTGKGKTSNVSSKLRWLPQFVKTFLKDLALKRKSKQWSILANAPWKDDDVLFIWEQHDIFCGPGTKLSKELNAPLITFVHAPQVWEAEIWGVKRYLWGSYIQRKEINNINKSRVVASVSKNVVDELAKMGVGRELLEVTPMSVDPELFSTKQTCISREDFGLEDSLTIGWLGSFRDFHGVDHLVEAFARLCETESNIKFVFIGEGQVYADTQQLVEKKGLTDRVVFTGQISNHKIPEYLVLFDIAIVSARSADDFHYSPHKLREYMALGIPSIAPRAGEVKEIFEDKENILLYEAGDIEELTQVLHLLISDQALRESIGSTGREFVLSNFTWDNQFEKAAIKLGLN